MPSFLRHGPTVTLCMGFACILSLWNAVSGLKEEAKKDKGLVLLPTMSGNKELKKEKDVPLLDAAESVLRGEEKKVKGVEVLAATELPARSVDLSALNLTELVNGMLSRALKADSKTFFSLLSITSYSSFAFHKVSVAIYNISNPKTVDPAKFPTRHCYCLNNRTNDLSDFTALLVDTVENSTSYLTEIFKSTSILSVSQTNESDCIFICVMVGKSGRNLSDFWEIVEKSPAFSYTFTNGVSSALASVTRETVRTSRLTTQTRLALANSFPASWRTQGTLKTFPWAETSTFSKGEATGSTKTGPELPSGTTATQRATSSVTRTPWVRDKRQTWTSTLSVPRTQTIDNTPRRPPWESHPSIPTSSADVQQSTSTESLLRPTGILATPSSPAQPSQASGTVTPGTQTPSPTKAPAPRDPQTVNVPTEWPFTTEEESVLFPALQQVSTTHETTMKSWLQSINNLHPKKTTQRCPQSLLKEGTMTAAPLLAIQKFNPCLMELCRFFQQCLCVSRKRDLSSEAARYCLEYYSWFLKNATLICQKVKRLSHSRTLKQKCLENICKSV